MWHNVFAEASSGDGEKQNQGATQKNIEESKIPKTGITDIFAIMSLLIDLDFKNLSWLSWICITSK